MQIRNGHRLAGWIKGKAGRAGSEVKSYVSEKMEEADRQRDINRARRRELKEAYKTTYEEAYAKESAREAVKRARASARGGGRFRPIIGAARTSQAMFKPFGQNLGTNLFPTAKRQKPKHKRRGVSQQLLIKAIAREMVHPSNRKHKKKQRNPYESFGRSMFR